MLGKFYVYVSRKGDNSLKQPLKKTRTRFKKNARATDTVQYFKHERNLTMR